MYQFIFYLKSIAALLITNSHFDNLYPVAALSIGGSLGNVLFFLVSGFLISNKMPTSFCTWIGKKFKRIYSSLWVISFALIAIGKIQISGGEVLRTLLFPYNRFWFVSAILIDYVLFYFIIKYMRGKGKLIGIATIVVYFVFYFTYLDLSKWSVEGPDFFKYIFYFGVMLTGYRLKSTVEKYKDSIQKNRFIFLFAACISLLTYLFTKIAIQKFSFFRYYQFTVQLTTLLFGIFTFLFLFGIEKRLRRMKDSIVGKLALCIGSSTLEIYLVNYVVVDWAQRFLFPTNIVIAIFTIFIIGICAHYFINNVILDKLLGNCLVRR